MAKRWAAVGLVLAMGAAVAADTPGLWKPGVPEAELPKLIAGETAILKKALDGGLAKSKRAGARAQVAALMVAGYAQSAMLGDPAKAAQLAGLRDHALQLAGQAAKKQDEEAKASAEQLQWPFAGKKGEKTEAVALHQSLDLHDLMSQFEPDRKGGREFEKKLKTYAGKRAALTADDLKEVVPLGYQLSVIAQFTEALAPAADQGKKKKADWVKWSQEMHEAGIASSKAAGAAKPDDKTVKTALKKLDESCTHCHNVFREQ